MKKFLSIFNKEFGSINQAALLLGFFTLLSQILALFRDRAIAHFVGPSAPLDAYYAAFRVPDLIFISIASLASITVLIPFIVAKMDGEKVTKEAQKFLNDVFTVFLGVILCVSVIAFFLMPYLIHHLIAPGFIPEMQDKVIILSRIMLLSPIFMGLSGLFGTITQLFKRFFVFSLSPIFYNLGIIFGVVFLFPIFGIYGMAIGVVLGALMHFLVQFFASSNCGFSTKFSFKINFKDIKNAALTSLPRTLGLAFNSIALISIVAMASFLKSGSISVFNFSFNLQSVPLNIIGVSYAVAAFPTLTKSFSSGRLDEYKVHLKSAARQIIFWSLPITFLFIVLRAQIVRVILGSGSFSWENTRLVAASLAIFSVSILAQGMTALLSRAYYAVGNTKKPLMINLFSSATIIILSYLFIHLFQSVPFFRYFVESILKVSDIPGTIVLMLPLAYSVGTILNFILQWIFIKRDFMKKEEFIAVTFFQSLGSSFFIGFVSYLSLKVFSEIFGTTTFFGVFLQGFFSGILGILSGILVLHLLKNQELKDLIKALRTKFWLARVIVPSQEEL
ncbi:MAG TPA: murein biosynthesis integral membrane protein MurJ [Candidatus Paceibacterota bacterium]|nr:murein biosynthesis integral membrane protein MurJ [Candidatus Paceibacterota bacterium]HPT17864.1 murein biosynthesis integral membrane protein MurJ [Candidatus Paceibacterota bacterium]